MDCPNNRYVNDERICQAVASMLAKVGGTHVACHAVQEDRLPDWWTA